MDRRKFLSHLTTSAAAWTATTNLGVNAYSAIGIEYPYSTIAEAFHAASFEPSAPDSAYFAVAADCHYGMNTGDGLLPIIKEINQLRPRPDFFLLDGDMIVTASTSFGIRPTDEQKKKAIGEFLAFRKHVDQLDQAIPLKIALGNHDTHSGEDEPELFHQVFPDHTAYSSFDVAGAHFVLLNGHSDGRIDPKQSDWFAEDIDTVSNDQEVITFVHQPSLGFEVRERQIAPAYEKALAEHRGNVWAICGHVHTNHDDVFQLPQTTIAQTSVVCSAPGIWGGPEKPGYWLYLLRGGTVVSRIFRRMDHGCRLQEMPNRSLATSIPKPFQFVERLRWKTLVGEGDRPYLIEHDANDNVTCWCYVRKLVYGLPVREVGQISRFAILGEFKSTGDGSNGTLVRISRDRRKWHNLDIPLPEHHVFTFSIPKSFQNSETLYVEVSQALEKRADIFVAGYALLA